MTRRRIEDRNIRKIFRSGASHALTIPKEMMKELGWREKQKVVVKRRGKSLVISDWK